MTIEEITANEINKRYEQHIDKMIKERCDEN